MYWPTNDPIRGREHVDVLLAAAGADLDPGRHGLALRFRGATFDFVSRPDLSEADYRHGVELLRSAGDEDEALHLSLRVAKCVIDQGDFARGKRLIAERLQREGGPAGDEGLALSLLSQAAFAEGDAAEGARLARDSAAASAKAGMTWFRSVTLLNTAEFLALAGELDAADEPFAEGLRGIWSVQDLVNMPQALVMGAVVASLRGDAVRAGTLWGAAEADGDLQPRPTTTRAFEVNEHYLEPVRGETFEQAREHGRTMSLEQAVAYALGDD
jgi:hypothetical protein